jgi:YHS domain-containing protein
MVICANCKKAFDSGPPKYTKSDDVKKVTLAFCSESCKMSYG